LLLLLLRLTTVALDFAGLGAGADAVVAPLDGFIEAEAFGEGFASPFFRVFLPPLEVFARPLFGFLALALALSPPALTFSLCAAPPPRLLG
jgi:hypothetical protein